jgi:putative PIN family toxin of toxin-antitoxin system
VIGVTADTNIYISAFNFGGLPRQFLVLALERRFDLAISAPIQTEVERILRDRFSWTEEALKNAAFRLSRMTRLVHPTQLIDAVPADPDDNRILECAVAAQSNYIVTGDKDLLRLGSYGSTEIIKVAEFLKLPPML